MISFSVWTALAVIVSAISLPFLVLTFLHYLHPASGRVLYRRCILNYIVTLILDKINAIISLTFYEYILSNTQEEPPKYIVSVIADSFFGTAYLLWSTVLCFDFWRKIKARLPSSDSTDESSTFIKRFICVWLISIIFTIVDIITEFYDLKSSIYSTTKRTFIAIVTIVILSNFAMLIHATVIIIKEKREIKRLGGCDTFIINKQNHLRKKMKLYGKLFVVSIFLLFYYWFWHNLIMELMSLTWIEPYLDTIFFVVDFVLVCESFQGLFIYAMFAFETKKVTTIKKRISNLFSSKTTLSEPEAHENQTNTEITNINSVN